MKLTIENTTTEWTNVKWYEHLKADGKFDFIFTGVRFYGGENPRLSLWNKNTSESITLWMQHHPNSQFTQSKPDGVRAVNAIARALSITGEIDVEDVVEALLGTDLSILTVTNTEKGRLWSVA